MDFRQLQSFVTVVEQGGFSRAAALLFLAQPTITAHINSLEKELNQRLLDRNTRRLELTAAGKIFLPFAQAQLAAREQLIEQLTELNSQTARISLAASSIPGQYLLPQLLAAYSKELPGFLFDLALADSAQVERMVADGRVDLGFIGSLPHSGAFSYHRVAADDLVVIAPNCEPYSDYIGQAFPVELLCTTELVLREKGSGTLNELNRWLNKNGLKLSGRVMAEFDDPESIKRAVAGGMGISVISERAAADYADFGQLLSFPLDPPIHRYLYLIQHKKAPLRPAAARFRSYVLDNKSE